MMTLVKLLKTTLEDRSASKCLCPELTDKAVTTLAFVTLYEGGERSFTFVRKPGADIMLDAKDDATGRNACRIQKCCTRVLSECPRIPSRTAHFEAMKLAKKARQADQL